MMGSIALVPAFFAYRDPWVRGWRIIFLVPLHVMLSPVACLFSLSFLDPRVVSDLLIRVGLIDGNLAIRSSMWMSRGLLILSILIAQFVVKRAFASVRR